ncbi:MAG TPA: hypothetical protein VFX96_19420 [Pyrinomonadaceae bacterium]|nr:hypothetical protein [Pyrinomonadaceae bacterium]
MCKRYLLFTLVAAVLCSTVSFASPNPDAAPGPKLMAAAPLLYQVAGEEFVTTYDEDCRTPKRYFLQGETVCARAENFAIHPSEPRYRLFQWGSPDGGVAQEDDINNDPEYEYFKIPPAAQVGTWIVKTTDSSRDGYGIGSFVVRSREIPWVNLQISKFAPEIVYPGKKYKHEVYVYSTGPDDAVFVTLTEDVPNDMIFLDMGQTSGPEFRCQTPPAGAREGKTVCEAQGMREGERATFTFVYAVDPEARIGTLISGKSDVFSRTSELEKLDSQTHFESEVGDPNPPQEEPPGEEP